MSARTIKSFTWLWIASLFVATVGVSGQQIYCYCLGKTTFSLFAADDRCEVEQTRQSKLCCALAQLKQAHNCCDKKNQPGPVKGCTKKTTRVFQLKTEFTIQEKALELFPELTLDQDLTAIPPFPVFTPVPANPKIVFQLFAHPPPLSGRMICVRHGVFLC